MITPIAVQLYTVREALTKDFAGTVETIARMGYAGVELAGFPPIRDPDVDTPGFPGITPEKAAKLFKELGLAVPAAHVPLPVGDDRREVLDTLAACECTYCVSMRGPDDLSTIAQIGRTCDLFNQAQAAAAQNGLKFAIHNHDWEFRPVEDGRLAFEVMRDCLDPAILFELDVYWIQTAGIEPAGIVRQAGPRAPLLHIKDGPARRGEPMVAVGDGNLDFQAIISAGQGHTEWLVVELDECATDMLEAVEKSYHYLVQVGLGRGNR